MDVRILLLFLGLSQVFSYEDKTIAEYIQATPGHIFLRNLINQANLTDQLSQTGPFTFFAPNDGAFAKLGPDALNQYTNRQLKTILEYHIHDGFLLVAMVSSPGNYSTLLGDSLLLEPTSPMTLQINGVAKVDAGEHDVIVNNGVVQPIDTVLIPPPALLTALNIAEVLIEQDTKFKDLFLALLLAELTTTLESENADYTVFAPTDAAFVKYRSEHFHIPDHPLDPNNPEAKHRFAEVLKYHVVPGGRRLKELQNGTLYTLHGSSLTISRSGTEVKVNNATVTEGDIYASNGMIHAIDTLLVPTDIRNPNTGL